MNNTLHSSLGQAVSVLFRPLAKVLIRNGIAWGTFAEWAKKVYVDVAFEEFAEPGKKQTISKVSALTGLFRRETKRLRELPKDPDGAATERYNRAVRVISGWLNDSEYHDKQGMPASLCVEGREPSFSSLVRKYSGDIPTQAMLSVLRTAGVVEEDSDGLIKLIQSAYIPGSDPIEKLSILGTDVAELIATIDHNLTAKPEELFFQRKVSNPVVLTHAVPQFREISSKKAQALLEELDKWLSKHEAPDGDSNTQTRYVSLGIYYSEHPQSKEDQS